MQEEIVRLEVLAGDRPPDDYEKLMEKKARAKAQEKNFMFFAAFGGKLKPADA
jgi:hypothetical protein